MTSDSFSWRLLAPQLPGGDAVEAALGLEVAQLGCGPLEFHFAKSRAPGGELVLTLRGATPRRWSEPLRLDHDEQVIPMAPERLPAAERRSREARYLAVLGRALFADVAHLARLEMESR